MTYIKGTELIQRERRRQKRKGFGARHDDVHDGFELTDSAIDCLYAYRNKVSSFPPGRDRWGLARKHHEDKLKLLVIAGALIIAESERLQRAAARAEREASL